MTQEGTDAVADAFLRAAHYRYTAIMGNDVTYEQYLEILKQPTGGEVNLLIMDEDGVTRREAMIDPRQGFSLLMTDKIDSELGVKYNREYRGFFGVDGQGRLLLADDFFSKYDLNKVIILAGVSITNYSFVWSSFTPLTIFGYLENKCMASGNSLPCGEAKNPPEAKEWWHLGLNKQNEMLANGKFEPFWGLERP